MRTKNKLLKSVLQTLLIFFFLLQQTPCEAEPTESALAESTQNTTTKDDLTTEWAKQIIRRSKASEIHGIMNLNAEPCNDFYQFACGNWHRNNPAQLFRNILTDQFQIIAKLFDRRLENVLTREARGDNKLENKVRNFYDSCQAVKLDVIQYKVRLHLAYKEFGQMPVLLGEEEENWNPNDFNWWETVGRIQNLYGKQIIFAVDIMGDIRNNTENVVYIGPPDFAIGTQTVLFRLLQEAETVRDLEQFFGVEHGLAKKTAKELIEFERKLKNGGTDSRLGLSLDELLTWKQVEKLNETYENSWDIQRFLEIILGEENVPENVYIYDENYLDNTLKTIEETPKRVLANYILWQYLQEYLVEAEKNDVRKWCLEKTKKYFGKYVDYMVYSRYRDERVEQDVYEVWHQIRTAFREELSGDKLDWIANATREYSIQKLDAMKLEINSYDVDNFTQEYENVEINRLSYIGNVQQLLALESRKKLKKLHEPATTLEAPEVLSSTPAYNILENRIKIPVALLQPRVFWDANYPQALKYATLGYLIAHEMVHGFDDEGRNYDKDGNQKSWWDYKSTYEFEARRKCFQAQYHNYRYGGHQLPNDKSQAENIADNAGIKFAYKAYTRWLNAQNSTNPNIIASETFNTLKFDNKQLFFIAFAQLWCGDVQTFFKSSVASADSHAPGMYRVIGSLSNYQEFAWVFKCPQDAPMDPEFKCSIY